MYWVFLCVIIFLLLVIVILAFMLYNSYLRFIQQEVKIHMLKEIIEKRGGIDEDNQKHR